MRRWNGWGDDSIEAHLPDGALEFLRDRIGVASRPVDATKEQALAGVGPSRLPAHPLVDTSAEARLTASFGQSLGDWLRLRFGHIGPVVDGVARPRHEADVRALLDWAKETDARVIAQGGATSVVGHLAPPAGERPVLALSLTHLDRLLHLDPQAQLATFEAGAAGPQIEASLRQRGFTLGHFPQSFDYSTLGGWIATRSSGQQSARYGRVEAMLAGARVETPTGRLDIPAFPASAAGPDLRECILGSEGRIGVITQATVRVTPTPEREIFVAYFLPDWTHGELAARELAQAKLGLSMLRLANRAETETTLRLAGGGGAVRWLERYLRVRRCADDKVLLLAGYTGSGAQVRAMRAQARAILGRHGAVSTGTLLGDKWRANRFKSVYLRNALWEMGYAVDTMETAVDWPRVTDAMHAMEEAGRGALVALDERCHAYTHLSHVYPQGSSVYSTFVFRIGPNFESAWARWRAIKAAVSDAIVKCGGTISHQHGVGKDHAAWLEAEKGARGMDAIAGMIAHFDPHGVMASGNLVADKNT